VSGKPVQETLAAALGVIASLVFVGCGSDSPVEPERSQRVAIDVSGTVTLDGVPVSWPMTLLHTGCEFGGDACSNPGGPWIVDETVSGADGTYRLSGQVPEDYCVGFPTIFVWVGDPTLYSWSPDCGESVLDFPLESAEIYRVQAQPGTGQ
jgi:hypothetical protein